MINGDESPAYLPPVPHPPRAGEDKMASLLEVMEANYMYNLPLEEYAKIANRSLATFKRQFKSLFYTTPGKWLIARRLDYAQWMLYTTRKNISEITFESGFENSSHFCRAFKQRFGQSPLNYRKARNRAH